MESFLASVAELNNPDQRAFLYSDLDRQKIDNPDGYKEAVAFWTRLLTRACQRGLLSTTTAHAASSNADSSEDTSDKANRPLVDMPSALTIDRRVLALRLVFRGDTPMGLDAVLDDMLRAGVLVPSDDYFAPPLRRWAKWLASRLLPQGIAARGPAAVLVDAAAVQEAASRLVAAHGAHVTCPLTDNIMSVDEFRRTYCAALVPDAGNSAPRYAAMSTIDAHVLLKHLADTHHAATSAQLVAHHHPPISAAAHGARATDLVKFATAGSPLGIAECDFATYQVVCTQRLLAQQVAALETRVGELDAEVRQALRRQQRPIAAARLRLKRHIETDILAKRIAALHTVEHVVLQLQQTSSDIHVVQALSAGTQALRALNDEAKEIDPDKVADAWEEEAARAAELGAALDDAQAAVLRDAAIDDADVEAELEALIAMESAKDETEAPAEDNVDAVAGDNNDDVVDAPADDIVDALADSMGKVEIAAKDTNGETVGNDKQLEERVAVPAE